MQQGHGRSQPGCSRSGPRPAWHNRQSDASDGSGSESGSDESGSESGSESDESDRSESGSESDESDRSGASDESDAPDDGAYSDESDAPDGGPYSDESDAPDTSDGAPIAIKEVPVTNADDERVVRELTHLLSRFPAWSKHT